MGENLPILVTISVQKIQAGASPQKLWFRPSFWPFNARIFAEKAPVFICTKMSSSEELVTLHFEYPLFSKLGSSLEFETSFTDFSKLRGMCHLK